MTTPQRFVNFDTGMPTPVATLSDRNIFTYSPVVYDLGSSTNQAVAMLFTTSGITVPSGDTYQAIGIFQTNRSTNKATIGAGSQFDGIVVDIESSSGSDVTSNCYAGVLHVTNDGPGTTKAVHGAAFGSGSSTGPIMVYNGQIQPVATNSNAIGFFSSLTTSGINGLAVGFDLESNGDQYAVGFGSTINPVPIATAYFRAWMATASAAGARAFQTLNNSGGEVQYVKSDGTVVSSVALIGGTESNGINLTQAAITRNNSAGSITIAAGTGAGNAISMQTGGVGRLAIADTGISLSLTGVASPSNANAAAAGVPVNGLYTSTADPAQVFIRTV